MTRFIAGSGLPEQGAGRGPANLRLGDLIDFRKHQGRFIFQRDFHGLEVALRVFAGAKFESQIAQIVVDAVAALQQLIESGAVRRQIGGVRLNVEDKN